MFLKSPLQLIGICGHSGTGKDTVARYLERSYSQVYTEHFADPLKAACANAFGLTLEYFNDPELKEQYVDFWGTTPRKMAQFVGTEMFRNESWKLIAGDQNDFWVRRLCGILNCELSRDQIDWSPEYVPEDVILIPDTRFQNEIEFLQNNNGCLIHLTRPGYEGSVGIRNHQSEKISDLNFGGNTWLIDNVGTEEELFLKVDKVVSEMPIQFMAKTTDANFNSQSF